MRRIGLLIALTASIGMAVPAVSVAGCMPATQLEPLCNYLAIPQSTCRGVEASVLSNPQVPQAAKQVIETAAVCAKVPNGLKSSGQDGNIVNLGQSTILPNESVDVGLNRSLFVHNLDSDYHTFTDTQCTDSDSATPCRFDKLMPVGSWGLFAGTIQISKALFKVGDEITFKCKRYAGYTGTLEITL